MSDAMQFHSRVGDDGVLQFQLDLGRSEAQKEFVVTVQPLSAGDKSAEPALSWPELLQKTYGSCAGLGLERHDQGLYEQREPTA